MMKMHGYRRVATTNPVNNPEGLAEDGECRCKSGDSIVKETLFIYDNMSATKGSIVDDSHSKQ